jgi:hypothetical protein
MIERRRKYRADQPQIDTDRIKPNFKSRLAAHPSSLPLLPKEKGKLEPPLSARERGGGEGRTPMAADKIQSATETHGKQIADSLILTPVS